MLEHIADKCQGKARKGSGRVAAEHGQPLQLKRQQVHQDQPTEEKRDGVQGPERRHEKAQTPGGSGPGQKRPQQGPNGEGEDSSGTQQADGPGNRFGHNLIHCAWIV